MMMVWHGKHFSITGHYKGYPTDTCGLHLKRIHSCQTKFYHSHTCIGWINEDFINDKSSFVEVMAWRRMAHQIMLIKFYDAIASPVSNELPNLRWRLIYTRPEFHDDVIKCKHFPRRWPFVRGIHRSPVNSPHKGQWRGALMFSLIRLNKRLIKQWRRRWFETPMRSLWRHYNVPFCSIFNTDLSTEMCLSPRVQAMNSELYSYPTPVMITLFTPTSLNPTIAHIMTVRCR